MMYAQDMDILQARVNQRANLTIAMMSQMTAVQVRTAILLTAAMILLPETTPIAVLLPAVLVLTHQETDPTTEDLTEVPAATMALPAAVTAVLPAAVTMVLLEVQNNRLYSK